MARVMSPGLRSEAQVREIVADEVKRALAALPLTASYDPKGEGYRRLSDSQRRDLIAIEQDRMFEIAYFMMDTSAMTRRLALLDKAFLFAEPISVISEDEAVQEVIDKFWKQNSMDLKFPSRMMWLGILGEQCWPVTLNPGNGQVRLGYMDPAFIKEVYVNSEDIEDIMVVELMDRSGMPRRRLDVVRESQDTAKPGLGLLAGECFYFAINHPPNSPRGRSDYLTLFDWIDSLERYGFNFLERAEFLLNFIWDVLLKGMNEGQIRDWLRNNPTPQPGAMRAHNENVEWKAVVPDIKAHDFRAGFDMAKSFVMGAAGRPESWFGGGGKAYQTEAEQFGQVPLKDFDERQLYIKAILEQVIQFVIDRAIAARRLPEKARDAGFQVNLPEISKKDLSKLIAAFPQFVNGLAIAEDRKWVRRETATRVFAETAAQFGSEIDADEEIAAAGKAPPPGYEDYQGTIKE